MLALGPAAVSAVLGTGVLTGSGEVARAARGGQDMCPHGSTDGGKRRGFVKYAGFWVEVGQGAQRGSSLILQLNLFSPLNLSST